LVIAKKNDKFMKKEYIKPNSEVICPSLQTYFEPASNGFTTTPSDEEYNEEFATKSNDSWNKE
jgi:hypothetical protein